MPGLLLLPVLLRLFLLFSLLLLLHVGSAGERQVNRAGGRLVGAEVGLRSRVVWRRLHLVEGVVMAQAGRPGGFGC